MSESTFKINRAPVMTLWAAVVAQRLGHDEDEALTLGKAVAGMNAQSKGRRLGIYEDDEERDKTEAGKKEKKPEPKDVDLVPLLGRMVTVRKTEQGIRALAKGQPTDPESVRRYLRSKFGSHLDEARAAMTELANAYPPKQLAAKAYDLYEQFRPEIPEGKKGWGAAGTLDLEKVRALGKSGKS